MGRRYWPTDGREWALLQHCTSFTQVTHVCRLIGNGVQEDAALRSSAVRSTHPRVCCGCYTTNVTFAFTTPTTGPTGLAWCCDCLPVDTVHRDGAAWVASALGVDDADVGPPNWAIA
eukprot:6465456-Alexandrium_andersonii.AAC.1